VLDDVTVFKFDGRKATFGHLFTAHAKKRATFLLPV